MITKALNSRNNNSLRSIAIKVIMTLLWCSCAMSAKAQREPFYAGEFLYEYTGSKQDYRIAEDANPGEILTFKIRGGDGGFAKVSDCVSGGGNGAIVEFTLTVGYGTNEIPPGTKLRFIVGGKGTDQDRGDVSNVGARGSGGGGTAVLAKLNDIPSDWEIIAVAGGGGGAYRGNALGFCVDDQDGQGGRSTTSGGSGHGTYGGVGGTNGEGGTGGGDSTFGFTDYAGGGGGAFSKGTGNNMVFGDNGDPMGGEKGLPSGGDGGWRSSPSQNGGWGFGGGGAGDQGGGGGGGYSGGGGGSELNNGGGGGSYLNSTYTSNSSIAQGNHDSNTEHGWIELTIDCPPVDNTAQIIDITFPAGKCNNFLPGNTSQDNFSVTLHSTLSDFNYRSCYSQLVALDNQGGYNGSISAGVQYWLLLRYGPHAVVDDIYFVIPKFEWQDEAELYMNAGDSSTVINAQSLVNLTGTTTPLIQNFNFQFLNEDGTLAEGEEKEFGPGLHTQKIGLISFGGTILCQYEMTVDVKAAKISVNDCVSGNVELIENIHPTWYRFNGHHTQWQSFSPEGSGLMESLYFEFVPDTFDGFEIPQNAILNIHRGEGTSGELIYTKNLAGTLGTFNTITIDETPYLQEDEVYTFAITDPTTTDWGLAFYINDFYPRGRHFIWNDRDVAFRVNIAEACDEDTGIVSTYMEDTEVGTTNNKTFTISNIGEDILRISSITSSNSQFTIGTYNSNIAVGASTSFVVEFSPITVGPQHTTISINSNDPDVPTYSFDIRGLGVAPLQLTCKDDLIFTLDENGTLELDFNAILDAVEGQFTASSINNSDTVQFTCSTIGDHNITLEVNTDDGLSANCSTIITVLPQITYPDIEDVTLYTNLGTDLPTYDYDISTFAAVGCPFSAPAQIDGLPSGSPFPIGTTTNTYEILVEGTPFTYAFDVTVIVDPVETTIELDQGELTITDVNTITDDDQITLSISDDNSTLLISGLNGSVELIGSDLSYEGDTGTVVSVPMTAITGGIIFNGRDGNNGITIEDDFTLSGTGNGLIINDISNYTQLGVLDIEGDFSITGDADIAITDSTFDGTVSLQGNTIDIKAIEGLTLGAITATGTAATDMNYIYSDGDILLSSPVQTAGGSNLTIRGNIVQQASGGVITTNELILEGNTFLTSAFVLDTADNNINKLSSSTTDHRTSGILFKDVDALELGTIDTGAIYFTADTFTLTESTNLTFSFDSLLAGGINQTATNSSSPARINHNGGKLRMYGATPYTFTGAFQYTAVAGTTTQITSTAVLIDTPNHEQTFGQLDMFFESFTVAAGSIVNVLNKGEFESSGTVLEGNGIVNGNIDIVTQASLDPGTDGAAGSLTINGDLKLYTTSINSNNFPIFKPFIESDVNYDVLNLTGTLELDNVKFEPTGDFTITDGTQEIVLIQNDGTDPIIGTFHGLPEGASFDFGGFSGVISYMGGDGNDFVLITDIIGPIAICQNLSFDLTRDNNEITITANDIDNGSSDNVGIVTYLINGGSELSYDFHDIGENTVTLAVFDAMGNMTECEATVTINIVETEYFITEWETTAANELVIIETDGNPGYHYVVDWGDGTVETHIMGDSQHRYTSAGIYNVSIIGDFPQPEFGSLYNEVSNRLKAVVQWGTNPWTSMGGAFRGCANLDVTATDTPDLSNATSLSGMFLACTSLVGNSSFNAWDVSNIEYMNQAFIAATNFNQDLSNWEVGNVTDMRSMFAETNFNQDISSWDVSNVTDMRFMFQNATDFDQDLGAWDISSINRMYRMFNGAGLSTNNYDNTLIGWATLDTSAGETQIPTNVEFHGGDSQFCAAWEARASLVETYGWTINDDGIVLDCLAPTDFFITEWQVSAGESITIPTNPAYDYAYVVDWGDGNINAYATGSVTHNYVLGGTFTVRIIGNFPAIYFNNGDIDIPYAERIRKVTQWGAIPWQSMKAAFFGCIYMDVTASDVPDLSQVLSLESMFGLCSGLTGDHTDFNAWNLSNITDINDMFYFAHAFNSDLDNWNVSNVTNMTTLFWGAETFNGNISTWDVSSVIDMDDMFDYAISFDQDLGGWDISSLADAGGMFINTGLSTENYDNTLIGWATLDTSAGETAIPTGVDFHGGDSQYCLSEIQRQELIDSYGWEIEDGGKVSDCVNPNSFITVWETTSPNQRISLGTGTDYSVNWGDGTVEVGLTGDAIHEYMLPGTYTVSIVGDFGTLFMSPESFDVSALQEVQQWGSITWESLAGAFFQCSNLDVTASDVPDLSNISDLNGMFFQCTSLVGNDTFNQWDVSNIESMEFMFWEATSFNQPLDQWEVGNVTSMREMFVGATSFDQDLGSWDISSLTDAEDMFLNAGLATENYDDTLIGWAALDTSRGETQIPLSINLHSGTSQYCLSETQRQDLIDTYGWSITDAGLDPTCPTDVLVAPKVYLQGAALNPNPGEEHLMRDDLRLGTSSIIISPYDGVATPEDVSAFFHYSGPGAFVDWVWVELRDKDDPSIVIAGQSAMLTREGNVVDYSFIEDAEPLVFNIPEGSYYVVINHRNHVGIMSSTPFTLSDTVTEVDLSSAPSQVEGGNNSVVLLPNGKYAMYSGDFDGNAQIQNSDANAVIQLIGGAGYEYADMDINNQIQNADVNALINPNIGRGEQFGRPGIATELLSSAVTVAFTNAEITNDGMDDYYEADIVISGTTDFYIGSGQVYLEYNTAAFGENVATNNSIAYSQPDGSILGYSFGPFSPAYRDFVQNDNTTSRVSLSFQQNIGLAGLETAPELQITSTPKVLFHIKIRYVDISADADICFYSEGVFQDQFFTACGGTATADCTNTPGVQITSDTYDCSEAGVGTLSITGLESEQILLYPNPTSSSFRIKGLTTTSQIRIYDVNGRLILEEQRGDDRPIDMSRYDNGIYLVEISTERGTQIKRLIKK
ncbi:BspA family leucine-rich repeat surface protein [Winogradskyella sp.]|uniref:BspA family leucine-rich repeat surface protein n=1 Tax=Winogradskyella sp. TaxID=1883156 RepID=UPI003BAD3732